MTEREQAIQVSSKMWLALSLVFQAYCIYLRIDPQHAGKTMYLTWFGNTLNAGVL